VGLLRAKIIGILLNFPISVRISLVKAPPMAAAPKTNNTKIIFYKIVVFV
jgi:hypothetical protein